MAIATRQLHAVPPGSADGRDAPRRVLDAAVEAGDLGATVAAIAGLTRSPVVLQDPFLAVLAAAPPPGGATADPRATVDAIALTRSGCPLVRELLRADTTTSPRRPALVELPPHGSTPPRLVARV